MKKILDMKKLFVFSLSLCLCVNMLNAENPRALDQKDLKKWTIEQITTDPSLRPEAYRWAYWDKDSFSSLFYQWKNSIIRIDAKTGKTDTILTLSYFNAMLKANFPELEPYKTLPAVRGVVNDEIVVFFNNGAYKWNIKTNKIELNSSIPEQAENLSYSRTSGYLVYTKGNNLHVLKDGIKIAVTKDDNPGIVNGQVVHRNEFGIKKGIFWNHEGSKFAFYRMDETKVGEAPLLKFGAEKEEVSYTRYPEAGTETHTVSVGVHDANTFKTIFLETCSKDSKEPFYITGITWSEDGKEIYTVELDRAQENAHVYCFDANTGKLKRKLFDEHNAVYVEPENPVIFRPKHPNQIIWNSERSGYNHLYLYDTQGTLLKEITPSDQAWEVSSIVGCSADGKFIYFMGTKESPLQQNLYSVNIDNGQIKRISLQDGTHDITMNANGEYFFDTYSNYNTPLVSQIIDKNGKIIKKLLVSADPLQTYNKPENRIFTIKAADGTTDLYSRLILPPNFDSTKKYPVIVYVYGGPHAQLITNSYLAGSAMFLQTLAQEGFIVFTVDSRGSDRRGFLFESCIHRNLGKIEVADQMKGVDFLKTLPYVDANRIGVDGWSYGGFMTMSLKLRHPEVFKVAVSGGGVINWAWYEIMYGERYMDTPQENKEGYQYSNLLNLVDSMSSKVLMIHGGLDATVLPKNSLYFIDECIKKNKQIDFFIYPGHEHGVRGKDRVHLDNMIYEYFRDNL